MLAWSIWCAASSIVSSITQNGFSCWHPCLPSQFKWPPHSLTTEMHLWPIFLINPEASLVYVRGNAGQWQAVTSSGMIISTDKIPFPAYHIFQVNVNSVIVDHHHQHQSASPKINPFDNWRCRSRGHIFSPPLSLNSQFWWELGSSARKSSLASFRGDTSYVELATFISNQYV